MFLMLGIVFLICLSVCAVCHSPDPCVQLFSDHSYLTPFPCHVSQSVPCLGVCASCSFAIGANNVVLVESGLPQTFLL